MLIDEYFEYQINFEKKYGIYTIVLMQVGSFFEFYGVNNDTEKIGDPQKITELLNIQLTRRNKSILENNRSNCLMAGFPTHSLKRFINILLTNNYTVILIEQTTEPPNPKREITQIYSPGTYIEEIGQSDTNNIIGLYIAEEKCYKTEKLLYIFGLTCIDLSTGISVVYEGNSLYYEKSAFLEEIYRFIEANNPKEIIVTNGKLNKLKIEELRIKINKINRVIHYRENIEEKYLKINYQNAFLKKVFNKIHQITPIEYLDLEKKNYALISFIYLLQFSYEHNERIIEKIQKPTHWEYNEHLILYNNAIYQLNIINVSSYDNGSSKIKSLYDIIQKTSTNMGKRLLKHRLMNPITNIDILNKRYDLIDIFLKSNLLNSIQKILNEIIDIERLHRKLSLQMLHPYEYFNLYYSYENIKNLLIIILDNFDYKLFDISKDLLNDFTNYLNEYNKIFNMNELGKYGLSNIGNSFFNKGVYDDIDKIQNEINNIYEFFDIECKKLSNKIEIDSDYVKLENNDREGYFLYTTKKRSEIMINNFNKDEKNEYELKKYTSTNIKINSSLISKKSDRLIQLKEEIKNLTKEEYLKTLVYFDDKYMDTLFKITHFIALIDVIKCSALCVQIYKYNKPKIIDKNNKESYFNAKDIRHPIIEVINEEVDYVKNNIELINNQVNGILLYGVNGSGKSSLSKAVGCNILLAQIGFYVPCSEFTYFPYKKIFTRINGDDNIFKGMSSFAVEMDELRSILKYSDNRSIVLGDELCKGTEENSALSIVTSSILIFCKKKVGFIFATHFHKLYEMDILKNNDYNIQFKHLSISYDEKNETIIYGRKLEDGPGTNLYGIEIAKYLIHDDEFIKNCFYIRNYLLNKPNQILLDKTSNYNNKLYIDCCSICGNNNTILDTHHIKEQNTFDKDDFNKDKISNIVVLCKKHHDEVHHGKLIINGYKNTIDGNILDYTYDSLKNNSKKKYSEKEIKIIQELAKKFEDYKNMKNILIIELKKHNIIISKNTLTKILKNIY
jgi:DNA mismatch repair protein MutS